MGAVCCCLHLEDFEDLAYTNGSVYRNCMCVRCFIHQLLRAYTSLFQQGEIRAVTSAPQGVTPLAAPGQVSPLVDNSLLDMYRSPPRPLPYDVDSRYSRLQRDGLISRREKASSHFHDESEPLQRNSSSSGLDSLSEKWKRTEYDGQSKNGLSDSSSKHLLSKVSSEVAYTFPSSEDEDVCPTCLEEYTPEDPKIITQCSHHFHLGCIYEWMERSESCPVCGKEMIFNESP
ncbi:E3 ubiquitin-protein ligase At3g02290-like [Nymphaea colorata]|nr:E3 ubiquitin-protein ligase At3g02290-like [Nymphaea colorata]XP_031492345.1 E3 ubiquitin-protein ligase At3g02290-like [Nymphaea colorata]XP_031492346.1 E3 ubiquitin-protein ligase At3g02290-like [Nymphaea colorata]